MFVIAPRRQRARRKRLAAVAPSGWQGLLIDELSLPRRLGRARGHTSACHWWSGAFSQPRLPDVHKEIFQMFWGFRAWKWGLCPHITTLTLRSRLLNISIFITLLQSCVWNQLSLETSALQNQFHVFYSPRPSDKGGFLLMAFDFRLICVLGLCSLVAYNTEKDVISAFFFPPYAASLSTSVQIRTCGYQVSIACDKSSASKADILLLYPKGGWFIKPCLQLPFVYRDAFTLWPSRYCTLMPFL